VVVGTTVHQNKQNVVMVTVMKHHVITIGHVRLFMQQHTHSEFL